MGMAGKEGGVLSLGKYFSLVFGGWDPTGVA